LSFLLKSLLVTQRHQLKRRQEVKAMAYYTTGEIAKVAKVTVRTIQYYDRQG